MRQHGWPATDPTETFYEEWDLRKIVEFIRDRLPSVTSVHLFGSRAHGTQSRRSDIDILVFSEPFNALDIRNALHSQFRAVDLFKAQDSYYAESIINGSVIRVPYEQRAQQDLVSLLGAICLWKNGRFTQHFTDWVQLSAQGVDFTMTMAAEQDPVAYARLRARLHQAELPDTLLGFEWESIGRKLISIVNYALRVPTRFNRRAKSLTPDTIHFQSEYDFQNFIHLILGPWLPDIEPESFVKKFDDHKRSIDFALHADRIGIEAKYVDSAKKAGEVQLDLDGIHRIYEQHQRLRLLIFLVYVTKSATPEVDSAKWESTYSRLNRDPVTIVQVIESQT